MVTDAELISSLDAMASRIEGVREDMAEEGRKRDIRIRTNRRALIAAVVAAFIGIAVGAVGVKTARDVIAERGTARRASCQQYNKQQALQARAEVTQSHDFVAALTRDSTDPAVARRVTEYNASHDALIRSEHQPRDCTPAGIARYLSKQPATKEAP